MKPKLHPAKVGSQPWLIVLKGASKPAVGRDITFRRYDNRFRWLVGRVTQLHEDGHMFIDLS